ncbi:hypothetical protein J2847_006346 [Azospirillum agricola]|uniref:hypothetical protein n=1 Tax=Azospirillum agricola TaxID=1720247 RepID=UPI001AE31945|nr:hypothetical protein [Azospirillum agricola]MBP2233011.1 hypothetical protein [Azospirillum agricola]
MVRNVWVAVAALAGGLLCGMPARAAEPRLTAALGDTVVKLIDVGPKVTRVVVDESTVFEDRESTLVSFVNAYTVQGRWMALLQTDTGAKDCPTRFRVLDLGAPKPSLSLPFGSCSDAAQVSTADNALTVSMPVPKDGGTAAWTYRDGRVARTR